MSITDELREWGYGFCGDTHDVVTAIADRIDAEHDKALNSVDGAYDSGYNVGYDEGFASADDWLSQHEDAMAEHGWVRLPVDADGVPIRIGDVMENTVCPSVHREVTGVGVECFYGWNKGNGRYSQFSANCYRHHKPDTWERIIEDAVNVHGNGFNPCWSDERDALVARCKALAGDAE